MPRGPRARPPAGRTPGGAWPAASARARRRRTTRRRSRRARRRGRPARPARRGARRRGSPRRTSSMPRPSQPRSRIRCASSVAVAAAEVEHARPPRHERRDDRRGRRASSRAADRLLARRGRGTRRPCGGTPAPRAGTSRARAASRSRGTSPARPRRPSVRTISRECVGVEAPVGVERDHEEVRATALQAPRARPEVGERVEVVHDPRQVEVASSRRSARGTTRPGGSR